MIVLVFLAALLAIPVLIVAAGLWLIEATIAAAILFVREIRNTRRHRAVVRSSNQLPCDRLNGADIT